MTTDAIIGTIFVICCAAVSNFLYKNKNNESYKVDKSKKIKSPASFKLFYTYLRYSTLGISIASYNFDSTYLLEIHNNSKILFIGMGLSGLSLALFSAAIIQLGKSYSPCYDSYVPKDFIKDGIYKFIRHPIYTCNILFLLGLFISTGSLWLFLNTAVLCFYYVYSAVEEEKTLERSFPEYSTYKKSAGMFIPSLVELFKTVKTPLNIQK